MKNKLLIAFAFLFCFIQMGHSEEIHLLVKIEKTTGKFLYQGEKGETPVPTKFALASLSEKLKTLKPGDEVLLTGHVELQKLAPDATSANSIFIITDLKPISLKRLGELSKLKMEKKEIEFEKTSYAPYKLTLPNTIAGSVVMTASVLLLHSMAMASAPQVQQDINTALIFSAGALATGLFINDEINPPERSH